MTWARLLMKVHDLGAPLIAVHGVESDVTSAGRVDSALLSCYTVGTNEYWLALTGDAKGLQS
jgi:hypothetical protein